MLLLLGVRSSGYPSPTQDSTSPALWDLPQGYRRQRSMLRHRDELCTVADPCHFALIADLDNKARVSPESLEFRSYLMAGKLYSDPVTNRYTVEWSDTPIELKGNINEGGRGLELSELILFKGELLSFDDRSGIVYEYTKSGTLISRHIITEGNGNSSKGMKIEWATEKDGRLWIGSFGKEYTDPTGTVKSEANFWIVVLDEFGNLERKNWKPIYNIMREKTGTLHPGYMLHEAIMWSPHLYKWVVLPRRVSKEAYNDVIDEKRGSNIFLLASKDFSSIEVKTTGNVVPERGFSSFKFVPGTRDQVILAVKSVEDSKADVQKSYVTLFSISGEVLLDDVEVPHAVKYEGVEFIPNEARFPFLNITK